ncbi:MAG: SH3 domain-containing protein [Alphaproteobacteria bacterium]
MIGGLVIALRIIAKTIVLAIAWTFWFFVGFIVWARVVIVSFVIFTMQITLAPFARNATGPEPATRFDRALRLWPEGFERIWRSVNAPAATEGDAWGSPNSPGFWSSVWNFAAQTVISILFWLPLILIVHHTGVLRIAAIDRIEHALVGSIPRGPPAALASALPSPSGCTGENLVTLWRPPRTFVTIQHVNTRSGPGTNYDKTGDLDAGQSVLLKGRTPGGDWSLISVDGQDRCFVRSSYLTEHK